VGTVFDGLVVAKVTGVAVALGDDRRLEIRFTDMSTLVTGPVEKELNTASTSFETLSALNDCGADFRIMGGVSLVF
jgi:hypothetical protein